MPTYPFSVVNFSYTVPDFGVYPVQSLGANSLDFSTGTSGTLNVSDDDGTFNDSQDFNDTNQVAAESVTIGGITIDAGDTLTTKGANYLYSADGTSKIAVGYLNVNGRTRLDKLYSW